MISHNFQSINPGYFRQQEQMSDFTDWLKSKAEPKVVEQVIVKEIKNEEKKEEKKEVSILINLERSL